jgi:hypothetical protein
VLQKRVFVLWLLLVGSLFASSKSEYEINLVGMKMNYNEYGQTGELLDSERSSFSDISGAEIVYRYFLDTDSSVNCKIFSVSGESEYTGSLIGSTLGYASEVSRTHNTIRDFSLEYTKTNETEFQNLSALGGLAVGYRYWERALSASQIEIYTWYSLRAQVGFIYNLDRDISISLIGEYQYGIDPKMSATGFSADFELKSADIIEVAIPVRYVVTQHVDLNFEYIFSRQKIGASNVVNNGGVSFYEPDSTAYNQYLKVGIVFKY